MARPVGPHELFFLRQIFLPPVASCSLTSHAPYPAFLVVCAATETGARARGRATPHKGREGTRGLYSLSLLLSEVYGPCDSLLSVLSPLLPPSPPFPPLPLSPSLTPLLLPYACAFPHRLRVSLCGWSSPLDEQVCRLRALQEKAIDKQALRDQLLAKRAQDQAEREWRAKQKVCLCAEGRKGETRRGREGG